MDCFASIYWMLELSEKKCNTINLGKKTYRRVERKRKKNKWRDYKRKHQPKKNKWNKIKLQLANVLLCNKRRMHFKKKKTGPTIYANINAQKSRRWNKIWQDHNRNFFKKKIKETKCTKLVEIFFGRTTAIFFLGCKHLIL